MTITLWETFHGATPLPLGREVYPFGEFPLDHRLAIAEAVEQPRPPARWLDFGLAQIESRAWYEWHWHRGVDPDRIRRSLPAWLRQHVIDRDGLVCGLCGGSVELADVHIDHILPVALGGQDDPDNLQVAHSRCNLAKGARC